MARVLLPVIVALLMIYCIVNVAQSPTYAVRVMPRWAWAVVVICLPLVGSLCWLVFGRPTAQTRRGVTPTPPKAPDDDIDFLRGL